MCGMNGDIRLLQLSDPHLHTDPHGTQHGVETLAALRAVLAHAQCQHAGVDALLLSGDIVDEEPPAYAHLLELLGNRERPVYCLPGNHDDVAQMRATLQQPPFQVCGHADLGSWRLILLDSVLPGQPGGHLADSELARLERLLVDSAAQQHVLIALHHHPVNMGSPWLDRIGVDNAMDFFGVIDRFAHVRAVVWGHVHQSFDARRKGVRLLATPSTCVQFLPLATGFTLDRRPPAYRRLTLRADGTVDTQVIWLDAADGQPRLRAGHG